MVFTDTEAAPAGRPSPSVDRTRAPVAAIAVSLEVLAFLVMVTTGGSPGWRALRALAVMGVGAAALLVERHAPRLGRGVMELILAVVGITAGAGIGVMHLVKADVTASGMAGIVALPCGIVLLVSSARLLWAVTPGWWRLLGIPLSVALVEFAFIPFTAAVYATNPPATPLSAATPADFGIAYQNATLLTADHVRLSGWYIPSHNGAAVVLLHGSGSNRTAVLQPAAVMAKAGYGVLLYDARGHGRSAGSGMDLGWWGDLDIRAAVDWLAGRPDVSAGRIAAVGMSMGGEEAIGAAASDSRLRAVVAEGALWRGSMDTGWLSRSFQGEIERAMISVQTAVTGLLTSAAQPLSLEEAVKKMAPRPLILIAGKPELRGDRYLRDASPTNVQLWELPNTPHISGLARHPVEWQQRVIGFLDSALAVGSR